MRRAPISSRPNIYRRRLLAAAPLLGATFASGGPLKAAPASAYGSTRPINLICPFPPGGSADTVSRLMAKALALELGHNVLVVNKSGAGGNIAADYVARSPADGYTLLVAGQAILAINQSLYKTLSYNPARDFQFISMIASMPNVLVIHPSTIPVNTFQEFIEHSRRHPGTVTYGSNGIGSLSHLTTEMLAKSEGISFMHVPYKGASDLMVDLLAGRIGFCLTGSALAADLAKAGKVKALAVTTQSRIAALPGVPSLVELGLKDMNVPTWFALMAPSGAPKPIVEALVAATKKITTSPAYATDLDKVASISESITPAQGEAQLKHERAFWAEAVKMTGATRT